MLKFTRETDYQQLTATVSEQEVTLKASYTALNVRVITGGAVRIKINDIPSDFSNTKGIYVDDNHPFVLNDHVIHKIKYIRDSGSSLDVGFEILGLYRENR